MRHNKERSGIVERLVTRRFSELKNPLYLQVLAA